jgi:hypothetical protein
MGAEIIAVPPKGADDVYGEIITPDRPRNFDEQAVYRVLEAIFGDLKEWDEDQDGYIAFGQAKLNKKPGHPIAVPQFVELFKRDSYRKSYICTATFDLAPDGHPEAGQLLRRKQFFKALWMVVLDDIGTGEGAKCTHDDLPASLQEPTYKISSSKDNYQYHYVLKDPISDLTEASQLVSDLYAAGPWDGGGASAVKFVRLPAGFHGRTDYKVQLHDLNPDRLFTPEMLLAELDLPDRDAARAAQKFLIREGRAVSGNGLADPLVDFMIDVGMVVAEDGDWVTIQCPWHEEHSKHEPDDQLAYYSPIGSGDTPLMRGFNCFHSACSDHSTRDFIDKLKESFGPRLNFDVPIYDRVAPIVRDWIYTADTEMVTNIVTNDTIKRSAFDTQNMEMLGKSKVSTLYWRHPARPKVYRSVRMPQDRGKLVLDCDEQLCLNTYRHPPWKLLDSWSLNKLRPWFRRFKYLYPDRAERRYILNWMAQKIQTPEFRGNIILSVATTQGTGRTTFWSVYRDLLGIQNTTSNSLRHIIGPYDDYLQYTFAVCNETSDKDTKGADKYAAAENIKRKNETQPMWMLLNLKSKAEVQAYVTTQQMLLTNHDDAMVLSEDMRRIYVATGPTNLLRDSEHIVFEAWRKDDGWQDHLFTFLSQRDLSEWNGYAPSPMTAGKERMIYKSVDKFDAAVDALLAAWPCAYIHRDQLVGVMARYSEELSINARGSRRNWVHALEKHLEKSIDRKDVLKRQWIVPPGDAERVQKTVYRIKAKSLSVVPAMLGRPDYNSLAEVFEEALSIIGGE